MGRREKRLDWFCMVVPLVIVLVLCLLFILYPEQSTLYIDAVRNVLGNHMGSFYIVIGLFTFLMTLYIAFSKYGKIRLGKTDKPEYTNFQWGTMIFTSTMAADILYYSCIEWALYGNEQRIHELGDVTLWSATYPIFHWGPIPWSFYLVLAAAFGFMIQVRKREHQKFSEACRPILREKADGLCGKIINLIAIIALLSGTATTFSVATPLLANALCEVLHIQASQAVTIIILLVVAIVYTIAVLTGFKGIMYVAKACTFLFLTLAAWVLFGGGEMRFIVETTISAIGNMTQHFVSLSTYMDPLRQTGDGVTGFVQNWTVFYWAYWLVWCVATPFFIGVISKGRTLKSVILGGYIAGLAGTYTSFSIFGNYGLAKQMRGQIDAFGFLEKGGDIADAILQIFHTLPGAKGLLILLALVMIAFYATTFDTLTMVISMYSYRKLKSDEVPNKIIRAFWAAMFIILPIGLLFHKKTMASLQAVSIIAAFPIGLIVVLIVVSFIKDIRSYVREGESLGERNDNA